jgi:hypothetical protein
MLILAIDITSAAILDQQKCNINTNTIIKHGRAAIKKRYWREQSDAAENDMAVSALQKL